MVSFSFSINFNIIFFVIRYYVVSKLSIFNVRFVYFRVLLFAEDHHLFLESFISLSARSSSFKTTIFSSYSPLSSIGKVHFLNKRWPSPLGGISMKLISNQGATFVVLLLCCHFLWPHEHHYLTIHHIAPWLSLWKVYFKLNKQPEYILYIPQVQLRFQY